MWMLLILFLGSGQEPYTLSVYDTKQACEVSLDALETQLEAEGKHYNLVCRKSKTA
jgi:hypothetical protein